MRNDNRDSDELREVKIEINPVKYAEGSSLIEIGDTRVLCAATIEDSVPPFLKDTGTGWVTAEYSMLPRSTRERIRRDSVRGKIGGRSHEIQRLIGRVLRSVVDFHILGEKSILIDCDVIQADGGTRTASITGAFVALKIAINRLVEDGLVEIDPVTDYVAAVSVGIVNGEPLLDLDYKEDANADVDMNIAMTGNGKFVEIQGTAEENPFERKHLEELIVLADKGIRELIALQKTFFN